jgi:hypothetical protein
MMHNIIMGKTKSDNTTIFLTEAGETAGKASASVQKPKKKKTHRTQIAEFIDWLTLLLYNIQISIG